MSTILTLLAIALPWAAGTLAALILLRPVQRGSLLLASGFGFFLGMLGAALILVAQDGLGIPLHIPWVVLVAILAILAILGIRLLIVTPGNFPKPKIPHPVVLVVALIIAGTFLVSVFDSVLRPVFPWDAWYLHAYKAHLFTAFQQIVPVAGLSEWLEFPDPVVFTTYTRHSDLIALVHAWPVLAAGQWQEDVVALSWPISGVAIALVATGFVLEIGYKPTLAAGIGVLAYTLPFLLVHSTLAGYADLWLAGFLSAGAAALILAFTKGRYHLLLLAIPLLAAAAWSKKFGIVYSTCVVVAALALILPATIRNLYLALAAICFVLGFLVLDAAAELSITFTIAGNAYGIENSRILLPLIPPIRITEPEVSLLPLITALFIEEHFHITAWILLPVAGYSLIQAIRHRECAAFTIWFLAAVFITVTPFMYTTSAQYLEIATVHVRMLLNLVLVSILFAVLATTSR